MSPHLEDGRAWVRFLETLDPDAQRVVLGHETGHVIDGMAGRISPAGIARELVENYSYGYTGHHTRTSGQPGGRGPALTPGEVRYRESEWPGERMAEAIRQYALAPDTFRELYPRTAARIRGAVNAHPRISPILQFNGLGPAAAALPFALGAGAAPPASQPIRLGPRVDAFRLARPP